MSYMLVTYIIASFALIMKPGPDLTCVIATALADGKARAATLMAGLVLGCWIWVIVLSAGVASVFTRHPAVMLSIQAVGTAYIAYLAVSAFREARASFRAASADVAAGGASASGWRLVGRGVFMAMSNPLTILFFLAFLPNFTREGATVSPALQTLALGTLFCALVPPVYLPVIFAADFCRVRLIGSPKAAACLKLTSALLLSGVAVVLAASLASGFSR